MTKMSIEQKAKAYDEALERAIEVQKSKDGLCVLTAESIFPELRESEDERMMREFNDWLCEEIECRTNDLRDEKDRRTLNMLCYILTKVKERLEKQKEHFRDDTKKVEQKPAQTDDEKEYIRTIKSIISDFIRDKKPEDVAYYQRIYDWLDGRHIEQKPAEWSYDNRIQYDNVKSGIEAFASTYSFNIESKLFPQLTKEQQQLWREEIEQAAIAGGESGIELARDDRYKENRTIEWSEEDEKMLNNMIKVLDGYIEISGDTRREFSKWLKSLKPQSKAEWSKEDEKHINIILRVLDRQQCWDGATGKKCNPYQDEIDWLKSLRPKPYWKPSEEQMEALKTAKRWYSDNMGCNLILESLFEQLEKQM